MQNIVFYDTETSGLNTMFGQIFQFAAMLTDENFQIIDRFEARSKRMPHIVLDPAAMLVTGITPDQLENAPHTYYNFSTQIREKLLEWSPAIFCGYNNIHKLLFNNVLIKRSGARGLYWFLRDVPAKCLNLSS